VLFCKKKEIVNVQFGTYSQELDNIAKRMIASYNILENEEYRVLIQAIEESGKTAKPTERPGQENDVEVHNI
jgi:hypothetical protein